MHMLLKQKSNWSFPLHMLVLYAPFTAVVKVNMEKLFDNSFSKSFLTVQ